MADDRIKVLYCDCAYADIVPAGVKREVLKALSALDVDLLAVADLCGMTAAGDRRLAGLASAPALKIVACRPRAVRWLFHRAGMPLASDGIEFLDMRAQSAQDIIARLSEGAEKKKAGAVQVVPHGEEWVPWFPVIDYKRCRNCRQCLSFCLFGVYEASRENRVIVTNPRNCKTNCSACSRICPEIAIIFAKEKQSPVDGAEILDEDIERRKVEAFKKEMSGGDMRAYLAERRRRAIARRLEREAKAGHKDMPEDINDAAGG